MSAIYLVLILKKFLREKTLIKNFFKYKSGVNHYHFARKSPYRNDWLYIFAPLQKWLHVLAGPKQSPANQLKIQLIICYNFLRVWIYVRLPFFKLEKSTTFFIGSWLIAARSGNDINQLWRHFDLCSSARDILQGKTLPTIS